MHLMLAEGQVVALLQDTECDVSYNGGRLRQSTRLIKNTTSSYFNMLNRTQSTQVFGKCQALIIT